MRNKIFSFVAVYLFLITSAFSQYQITNSVISNGGAITSNANYIFNNTIGESFIDKISNTTHQQNAGFWYVYQQSTITSIENEETMLPVVFKLEQNYPNPFNPSTTIQFSIPQQTNVTLKVYDVLGNEVASLVNEEKARGVYNVNFNASQLASGVYFYRIQAGNFVETKKMILMK